jgi:hypothetical protein
METGFAHACYDYTPRTVLKEFYRRTERLIEHVRCIKNSRGPPIAAPQQPAQAMLDFSIQPQSSSSLDSFTDYLVNDMGLYDDYGVTTTRISRKIGCLDTPVQENNGS